MHLRKGMQTVQRNLTSSARSASTIAVPGVTPVDCHYMGAENTVYAYLLHQHSSSSSPAARDVACFIDNGNAKASKHLLDALSGKNIDKRDVQ
jgi:hypothetical protein